MTLDQVPPRERLNNDPTATDPALDLGVGPEEPKSGAMPRDPAEDGLSANEPLIGTEPAESALSAESATEMPPAELPTPPTPEALALDNAAAAAGR